MILDKEWFFNTALPEINLDAQPIHHLAASYDTFNADEDVHRMLVLFEKYGVEDNFLWAVANSKRLVELSGVPTTISPPAAATMLGGEFFILFDVAMLEDDDIAQDMSCMVDHELVHLEQFRSGRLAINDGVATWKNGEDVLTISIALTYVMFNGNMSLAYQYALPWETEAYDAELLNPNISKVRREAIECAQLLVRHVWTDYGDKAHCFREGILWMEIMLCIVSLMGRSQVNEYNRMRQVNPQTSLEAINYCKEVIKSLVCNRAKAFDHFVKVFNL